MDFRTTKKDGVSHFLRSLKIGSECRMKHFEEALCTSLIMRASSGVNETRRMRPKQSRRVCGSQKFTTTITFLLLIIITKTAVTAATSTPAAKSTKPTTSTMMRTTTTTNGNGNKKKQECKALDFLDDLRQKYPHQPVFIQAVEEMALSLQDLFQDPEQGAYYKRAFAIMAEPERTISFRVPWTDDQGNLHINRGWRVQFSSVLGPYKGGIRLHPTVDEGILKFLGFEQMFKNALTGLPMGGGKGGSDFDPKGKSEGEVRRFCQSFMTELFRFIGPSTDVPAGDIGVGGREIGYMYGTYKRLTNKHGVGVLTGKSLNFGGSPFRPEATGYGLIYMTQLAFKKKLGYDSLAGLRCAVSGAGNVAQFAAKKLIELGAKVITINDSTGVLVFENGMSADDLTIIEECKNKKRARLSTIADRVSGKYIAGKSPWSIDVKYDIALPCATQNEIKEDGAKRLVANGVMAVLEGANLPTNMEAQQVLRAANVLYVPGKATNAGGVGVSGLEMSQNAQRLTWKPETVDNMLQEMMSDIYDQMEAAVPKSGGTLEAGANRAGFLKVVEALGELGWFY